MPEKPIEETSSARRVRKCRACRREVTATLVHGECADCAGLIPLPLRGPGGRFLSFGTSAGTSAGKAGER